MFAETAEKRQWLTCAIPQGTKAVKSASAALNPKEALEKIMPSVGTLAKSAQNTAVCQRMVFFFFFPLPLPQFASLLKIFQADPGNFWESASISSCLECLRQHSQAGPPHPELSTEATAVSPFQKRTDRMLHTSKCPAWETRILGYFNRNNKGRGCLFLCFPV